MAFAIGRFMLNGCMKLAEVHLSSTRFEEMSLDSRLLIPLQKMSITKPTEVQSQSIPLILQGQELVTVAQTGSGKTLAFALPILTKILSHPDSRALVLSPSREMAQQIYNVFCELCKDLPVIPCLVVGGEANSKQASQLKKNPRLLIATPGRMNDHLQTNKLLLQKVDMIVIDEADRMLDLGFAPQLKSIQNTLRGHWQTLMFSASFSEDVQKVAKIFTSSEVSLLKTQKAEKPVSALKQKVIFLDESQKNDRIVEELKSIKGSAIVYTGNQYACEIVGRYLTEYGYQVEFVHGGLSQGHRNRVVREFRAGDLDVLVATDLLARGIDIPHVKAVINFELPFESEDFLHRIGRTARAGRTGLAITFVTPKDSKIYKKILPYLEGAHEVRLNPNFEFRKPKYFAKSKN
jgi:ATP-dependent RNA helicase RhlE